MDNKKKLSLKLKEDKEALVKKAINTFINRSSGDAHNFKKDLQKDKRDSSFLTAQESHTRLEALSKHKQSNEVSEIVEKSDDTDTSPIQPAADNKLDEIQKQDVADNAVAELEINSTSENTTVRKQTTIINRNHLPHKGSKIKNITRRQQNTETQSVSPGNSTQSSFTQPNLLKVDNKPKHHGSAKSSAQNEKDYEEGAKSVKKSGFSFRNNLDFDLYDDGVDDVKPLYSRRNSSNKKKKSNVVNLKKGQVINIDKRVITSRELSVLLSEPKIKILSTLKKLGEKVKEDEPLKRELVEMLAIELGHEVKYKLSVQELLSQEREKVDDSFVKPRAPVVTVMGHIDHGKTTLLDTLRSTSVTQGESGGITQHIGAYQVRLNDGRSITFIDTPGHAAFTSMRMRGAELTDVVVLVVAADDGVNEQTVEAIKHAKAANVPIIVAINKIDKKEANPEKVMVELIQHGITVEAMQGDVMSVNISARDNINIDKLEELILLQAEFLELKYNPIKQAEGIVIESRLDKRCGAFTTLIVKDGELKKGDIVVLGDSYGKVRNMIDSFGNSVKVAVAGTPVEVMGFNEPAVPGNSFIVVKNEKDAKFLIESKLREKDAHSDRVLRDFGNEKHKLNFIIKADVNGSAEALAESIIRIEHPEIEIKVMHIGIGDVNESDLMLAEVSDAYIIGFRVKTDRNMTRDKDDTKISFHSIIYDAIAYVRDLIKEIVSPKMKTVVLGAAVVKEIFTLSDKRNVAGCQVKSGLLKKSAKIRVIRNEVLVVEKEFSIGSLKRFKEEVKEVKSGYECGVLLNGFDDFAVGDTLEAFEWVSNV